MILVQCTRCCPSKVMLCDPTINHWHFQKLPINCYEVLLLYWQNTCPFTNATKVACSTPIQKSKAVLLLFTSAWGFAILCCSIIVLAALCGFLTLPFVHGANYKRTLIYMVGLAVGTLTGSSLLFLTPEVMSAFGDEFILGQIGEYELSLDSLFSNFISKTCVIIYAIYWLYCILLLYSKLLCVYWAFIYCLQFGCLLWDDSMGLLFHL